MKTLLEYVEEHSRPACVVCDLDEEVVAQVNNSVGVISRPTVRKWLKAEYGVEISKHQLFRHFNGHANE